MAATDIFWYFGAFCFGYVFCELMNRQYVSYVNQSKEEVWKLVEMYRQHSDENFRYAAHYKRLYEQKYNKKLTNKNTFKQHRHLRIVKND